MNDLTRRPVVVITCGVFAAEVAALISADWPDMLLRPFNSMLHMKPDLLGTRLAAQIKLERQHGHPVLLVYGDCSAAILGMENQPGVVRTQAHNCCELLLGWDEYRRLEHERVFFLLPEWARRWQNIFIHELGLSRQNARDLMQDMHSKLVYLDTGLAEVPIATLTACAEFTGLPYEVLPVSLEALKMAIEEALARLVGKGVLE
jgi:hypothetical protein